MLCEIGRWQVSKRNSNKHIEKWTVWMDYIKTNRDKFHFTHSRLFILETKSSAVEDWMFIDEYKDQRAYAYNKTMKAVRTDAEIVKAKIKLIKDIESSFVPNSFKTEIWVEKTELGV